MHYRWTIFRLSVTAALVVALAAGTTAAGPAAAGTNGAAAHRLIVVVKTKLAPAAEKKFAVLVLISQNGGAPAGALATPGEPLTVLLANRGLYRVKAEIDSCKGTCAASSRIAGTGNHRLEIVASCRPAGARFVCSKVTIVKVY